MTIPKVLDTFLKITETGFNAVQKTEAQTLELL